MTPHILLLSLRLATEAPNCPPDDAAGAVEREVVRGREAGAARTLGADLGLGEEADKEGERVTPEDAFMDLRRARERVERIEAELKRNPSQALHEKLAEEKRLCSALSSWLLGRRREQIRSNNEERPNAQ